MDPKTPSACLRRGLRLLCAPLIAIAIAMSAQADTLDKIRETGTITIGNRENARPFSYVAGNQQPTGYSIELCQRIAESVKKELNLPDLKVAYRTLSGPERIPKLLDGTIDLECGSTTNTQARQEKVAFSYTIFIAGMKILSADPMLKGPEGLVGKKVALSKGTTSEKLFLQLKATQLSGLQVITYPNNVEALKALQSGAVTAFPQDDVLLSGLLAGQQDANRFMLTESYLSIEPYAIMVRKGDKRLLSIVDGALRQLFESGEINRIYARWFDSTSIKIPMSALLRDAIIRPGKEAGFARELGYSL